MGRFLAGVLCGALVAGGGMWAIHSDVSEESAEGASNQVSRTWLAGELSSLRREVGALAHSRASETPSAQRTPVGEAAALPGDGSREPSTGQPAPTGDSQANVDTTAELELLVREFRELLAQAQRLENRDLHILASEHDEVQWLKIEQVVQEHGAEGESLTEALRLLSDQHVIQRFGAPTDVWASPNHTKVFWAYNRDVGAFHSFGFALQSGYVVEAWAE